MGQRSPKARAKNEFSENGDEDLDTVGHDNLQLYFEDSNAKSGGK